MGGYACKSYLSLCVFLPLPGIYIQLAEKHKTMLDEVVLTSQEAADEHMTRVEEIEERYKV